MIFSWAQKGKKENEVKWEDRCNELTSPICHLSTTNPHIHEPLPSVFLSSAVFFQSFFCFYVLDTEVHCGTKPGRFEASRYSLSHELRSEWVSELCEQTGELTSERLSTHVPILGCFEPLWSRCPTFYSKVSRFLFLALREFQIGFYSFLLWK